MAVDLARQFEDAGVAAIIYTDIDRDGAMGGPNVAATEALAPLVDRPRLLMLLLSVIKMAGIDPVYFGLMFIINSCIGLITPPVGSVLNVVCGVGKAPMSKVVRGTLPFVTVTPTDLADLEGPARVMARAKGVSCALMAPRP